MQVKYAITNPEDLTQIINQKINKLTDKLNKTKNLQKHRELLDQIRTMLFDIQFPHILRATKENENKTYKVKERFYALWGSNSLHPTQVKTKYVEIITPAWNKEQTETFMLVVVEAVNKTP